METNNEASNGYEGVRLINQDDLERVKLLRDYEENKDFWRDVYSSSLTLQREQADAWASFASRMNPDAPDSLLNLKVSQITRTLTSVLAQSVGELESNNKKIESRVKHTPDPQKRLFAQVETYHLFRPKLEDQHAFSDVLEDRETTQALTKNYATGYAMQLLHNKLVEHGKHTSDAYTSIEKQIRNTNRSIASKLKDLKSKIDGAEMYMLVEQTEALPDLPDQDQTHAEEMADDGQEQFVGMPIPETALAIFAEMGGIDGLLRRYILACDALEVMKEADAKCNTKDAEAKIEALWQEIEGIEERATVEGNKAEGQAERDFTMNFNRSLIQSQAWTVRQCKNLYEKLSQNPDAATITSYETGQYTVKRFVTAQNLPANFVDALILPFPNAGMPDKEGAAELVRKLGGNPGVLYRLLREEDTDADKQLWREVLLEQAKLLKEEPNPEIPESRLAAVKKDYVTFIAAGNVWNANINDDAEGRKFNSIVGGLVNAYVNCPGWVGAIVGSEADRLTSLQAKYRQSNGDLGKKDSSPTDAIKPTTEEQRQLEETYEPNMGVDGHISKAFWGDPEQQMARLQDILNIFDTIAGDVVFMGSDGIEVPEEFSLNKEKLQVLITQLPILRQLEAHCIEAPMNVDRRRELEEFVGKVQVGPYAAYRGVLAGFFGDIISSGRYKAEKTPTPQPGTGRNNKGRKGASSPGREGQSPSHPGHTDSKVKGGPRSKRDPEVKREPGWGDNKKHFGGYVDLDFVKAPPAGFDPAYKMGTRSTPGFVTDRVNGMTIQKRIEGVRKVGVSWQMLLQYRLPDKNGPFWEVVGSGQFKGVIEQYRASGNCQTFKTLDRKALKGKTFDDLECCAVAQYRRSGEKGYAVKAQIWLALAHAGQPLGWCPMGVAVNVYGDRMNDDRDRYMAEIGQEMPPPPMAPEYLRQVAIAEKSRRNHWGLEIFKRNTDAWKGEKYKQRQFAHKAQKSGSRWKAEYFKLRNIKDGLEDDASEDEEEEQVPIKRGHRSKKYRVKKEDEDDDDDDDDEDDDEDEDEDEDDEDDDEDEVEDEDYERPSSKKQSKKKDAGPNMLEVMQMMQELKIANAKIEERLKASEKATKKERRRANNAEAKLKERKVVSGRNSAISVDSDTASEDYDY